jgi:hypothetical protein
LGDRAAANIREKAAKDAPASADFSRQTFDWGKMLFAPPL